VLDKAEADWNRYVLAAADEHQQFSTGAVRDIGTGKGRPDLISPIFLRRLALIMEKGATKYGERNWEKGMPVSRFIGAALRHLNQFLEGFRDEDHLAQAGFNVMGALHTLVLVERGLLPEELSDLATYLAPPPADAAPAQDAPQKPQDAPGCNETAEARMQKYLAPSADRAYEEVPVAPGLH